MTEAENRRAFVRERASGSGAFLLAGALLGFVGGCDKRPPTRSADRHEAETASSSAAPASLPTMAAMPGASASASSAPPASSLAWDPATTRVFVTCLAQFEGEKEAGRSSFSMDDRLDGPMVDLFEKRGVPRDHVIFLKDDAAKTDNVRASFDKLLAASAAGETLVFYFGSHGGYDAKTGVHTFSTFDGSIPMDWAIDTIEAKFKGDRALLFSDTCYSGGLVETVARRKTRVAYGALSSTSSHNVAYSQWRFIDTLMRGFGGDPILDANRDGKIDFGELERFTEHEMAFVAEGKPIYATTEGFTPAFALGPTSGSPRKDARIGAHLEVEWHGSWYKADVLDVKEDQELIHYASSAQHRDDEWVPPSRTRAFTWRKYAPGDAVEIEYDAKWYEAKVLEAFDELYLCHYDKYDASWDEWIAPSRIRPASP